MSNSDINTPVLILLFNRPDTTRQLIDALRIIRPKYLYISQDWPRHDEDSRKINEVREVLTTIDWECQRYFLYRDENIGCYHAVTGWISWFFEHVNFGLILEDDCIPHKDFFLLCSALEDGYRKDNRIWLISGSNFNTINPWIQESYFFTSHSPLLWGWATWKEKWQLFDTHSLIRDKLIRWELQINESGTLAKRAIKSYMLWGYWDSDWYMVCYFNKFLTIVPKCNLISNIWFIGIHNARPWKYHNLDRYSLQKIEFSDSQILNQEYESEMISFQKVMYVYWLIEKWLSYIRLDKAVKFIVRIFFKLIYYKKNNH